MSPQPITNPPFITLPEFETAITGFQDAYDEIWSRCGNQRGKEEEERWRDVRVKRMGDEPVLVIGKDVRPGVNGEKASHDVVVKNDSGANLNLDTEGEGEIDDHDVCITRPATVSQISLEYHIILSPSYQVPVLYFNLTNLPAGVHNSVEALHRYVVPPRLRGSLQAVGVMGAISHGYHPVNNIPMFFIHPCNTADALCVVIGGREIEAAEYLLIWLGLVGGCVNLSVPSNMAEKIMVG